MAMGGSIAVSSPRPNGHDGTSFMFELTFDKADAKDVETSRVQAQTETYVDETAGLLASTGRAVIADDDEFNRLAMRTALMEIIPKWDMDNAATAESSAPTTVSSAAKKSEEDVFDFAPRAHFVEQTSCASTKPVVVSLHPSGKRSKRGLRSVGADPHTV